MKSVDGFAADGARLFAPLALIVRYRFCPQSDSTALRGRGAGAGAEAGGRVRWFSAAAGLSD